MVQEAFQAGLPAFSLRPGLVYAAESKAFRFLLARAARHRFYYVGDGQGFRSAVYIGDLAEAYALAIERPPVGEALNLVDDEPLRWRELAEVLLGEFGGGKANGVPAWIVSLFAGSALVEIMASSCRASNARAKERLGWQLKYASLRDGIGQVVRDYRESTDNR
jgi:nucleoside-diphosphate-sugar epimerase